MTVTHLLRAEWTKFRTVRGWVITMTVAALVTVLLGVLMAAGSHMSCMNGQVEVACPAPPVGPGGEAVRDEFSYLHTSLEGDGSITARLTSMTGIITYPPPDHTEIVPGLVPWAKAGIIVKESTRQGSAYAALLMTGSHGVRMQHDFTHDVAGRTGGVSAASPRWLRLTRVGNALTGDESTDGKQWTRVGNARLSGLPATVQVGLFANSPGDLTVKQAGLGGSIGQIRFTQTTAVFDNVTVDGTSTRTAWQHDDVGGSGATDWERYHRASGAQESSGAFTVTGSGDIAPVLEGQVIERTLAGAVTGLLLVIVVAVMFMTAEYRRGLIRTTLLAGPGRGRMLAAKATVIAGVTFITGLAAAGIAVPLCTRILQANGNIMTPGSWLTAVRVIVGTAAVLAVAAVLALALGALFRRSVAALTAAMALIAVPYMLATAGVLPDVAAQWLLRVTPAAGFAIQQSVPEYAHVLSNYTPAGGYYPLAPWAGFAVLCGYAALALALAVVRMRRRDA